MTDRSEQGKPLQSIVYTCGPQCIDGTEDHKWDGPEVILDGGRGASVTCSKCGKLSIDVCLWWDDGLG